MTRTKFIMKWLGTNKPYDQYHRDEMMEDLDKVIAYAKQLVKNCNTPAVVGRSEQLVCDCGKPYHERDLEHGMCHQCWEPTKEGN